MRLLFYHHLQFKKNIRRYLFILIGVCFLAPSILQGQIYKLGIENSGYFSSVPVSSHEVKSSQTWDFSIIPFIERIYHKYFEVGVGLGVSSLSQTLSTEGQRFGYRANFLSLPLYGKLRTKMFNYNRYFLRAGMSFHFKVSENSSVAGLDFSLQKNMFKELHLGFLFGLGIEYAFMNGFEAQIGLDIQIRNNPMGFTPAQINSLRFINFGFYMSLCYEFNRMKYGY